MTCPHCAAPISEDAAVCVACGRALLSATFDAGATPSGPLDMSAVHATVFSPGQAFGPRYTIVEEVGSGGMGQVYKAIDRDLGHAIALKLIRPKAATRADTVERFRRELALAQQVTHPNVCRVHDLGEAGGVVYISMEFVEGQTLEDLIQSVGHLSPRQTVLLGRQICAGLQAIHEQAIVHRDLKPGNIMVDRSGHALVMDFGMAYHPASLKLTREGAVLGTLAYLSPEQARGLATDARADIYALGLILFEMLTGRRAPGDNGPAPLALRDSDERCPPPSRFASDVPKALDAVVSVCLDRDPARRYATAADLASALAAVPTEASSSGSQPIVVSKSPARKRALLGAGVLGALLLASWAAYVGGVHAPSPKKPATIAILPLLYSGPEGSVYLKEALPIVLGEALRGAEGLDVAPFASSRTFDAREDPEAVARQMGVASVIFGSVTVSGDKAKIDLTVSGPAGRTTWRKTQETSLRSIFTDTERVAGEIASAVGARPGASRRSGPSTEALDLYLRGKTLLEGSDLAQDHGRAEEAFRAALAIDERFAEAHAGLALALRIRYDATQDPRLVEPALAAAKRAVSLAPTLPEAQVALGVVQLWRGLSAEAAASFQRAQDLAPADDAVCRHIADAYNSLGRDEDAERLYQRAIEIRAGYWENYNAKGKFYATRGKQGPAKEMFSKVIELRPQSNTGYNNKAAVHLGAGELKEAEPLLLAALKIAPDADVHSNLGFVYYGTGRFEEAAREFHEAIDAGAEKLEIYGNLGDAYRQLGRSIDARSAYAHAIDLGLTHLRVNPSDSMARASVAMDLAATGRCAEAQKEAARAIAGPADLAWIHYYAAVAYALCNDRGKAIQQTAKAIAGGAEADVRTNPDLRQVRDEPAIRELLR